MSVIKSICAASLSLLATASAFAHHEETMVSESAHQAYHLLMVGAPILTLAVVGYVLVRRSTKSASIKARDDR